MTRILTLLLAAALAGCGSPPPKQNNANAATNGTPNNGTTATNNGTTPSNNGTTGRDIWAADYDQSCEYDGECVVVHEGDACLCGGSACGNTGINSDDLETWLADREALCPPDQQICSGAPCELLLPVCTTAGCDARTPIEVDPSRIDTSCEVDTDCTIVIAGEICSSCKCGGTAVNAAAAQDYLDGLGSVDCRPGPQFCDCAVLTDAYCDGGVCQPGVRP